MAGHARRRVGAGVWMGAVCAAGLSGCANPGPPRPPSLFLPAPPHGVTASRTGDTVEVRFAVPTRSTDNLPLRDTELRLKVCREVDNGTCTAVGGALPEVPVPAASAGAAATFAWTDTLPVALTGGPLRLLGYRVELLNGRGRSAGASAPAYTVAGAAPRTLEGLAAAGSRLGVVLSWAAAPADGSRVVLRREDRRAATVNEPGGNSRVVQMRPPAGAAGTTQLLDTAAQEDVPYVYSGYRERTVRLAGQTLVLRSAPSADVAYTLRDVFPPPAPTDLSAVAVPAAAPGAAVGVDLIWQPVEDPGLAGYNVYREAISGTGQPQGERVRMNAAPVAEPAFHDATAGAGGSFRWTVTAVDQRGNESVGVSATLTLGPAQ